ncbi:DUF402 domain-containing protein [Microbacterium sp. ANT_H45B]|uniref:DUF402 domain-containing protein n=1 Tax=Microbacterium sp. ANT_H45B TaxID=2597346 RepID=UPI0011ED2E88|nr:DUF402 domain-containing protein [Microbacterium sp. ANT_H45B]KAA0959375.1 DUF402 domain-containing protein [Microbacterium sp. ANT_H45B]
MSILPHSTPAAVPDGARPMGEGPFLRPGDQIDWHYRPPGWQPGDASTIAPMRVVRDDERGLVAWLAPGTLQEAQGTTEGERIRTVPLDRRWLDPRTRIVEEWWGNGILRIAPAGAAWSVWLFWSAAEGSHWRFAGWYVNLENAHLRTDRDTYSSDHILDVQIDAEGSVRLKDEDELAAAIEQGRLTGEQAAQIERHASAAIESFRAGDWPFDPEWQLWRPDTSWTVPELSGIGELRRR